MNAAAPMADSTLAKLIAYPIRAVVRETPSLLIASLTFRKPLGAKVDALAILATEIPRERVADFDWMAYGIEEAEGPLRTWVYRLRVRKRAVDGNALAIGDLAAVSTTPTVHLDSPAGGLS